MIVFEFSWLPTHILETEVQDGDVSDEMSCAKTTLKLIARSSHWSTDPS